jgi:hypothetical protein
VGLIMLYLSPSSLLGEAIPQPFDKKAIQLTRKKWLAELELNEGKDIEIHGKFYGKNDIINYFEDLLQENTLSYHDAISKDPVLLRLLEEAGIEPGQHFMSNPLYKDPSFIQWISPWFFISFHRLTLDCFETAADLTLTTLFSNPMLMTASDQEQVWIDVAKMIRDNIDLLDRYQAQSRRQVGKWRDNNSIPLTTISRLMDFVYIRMLCLLPVGRFSELRNKYAFVMMQACIHVFNRHPRKRDSAGSWLNNAESLAVSPELKAQIIDKLDEFRRIRKKSMPLPLRIILIIIVVGYNLFRFLSSSNDPNPQYQPNNFHPLPPAETTRVIAPDSSILKHPHSHTPSITAPSTSPTSTPSP